MAYLDEDILYNNIEEKYKVAKGEAREAYSDVLDTICEMPRADVVPKSVVERLEKEFEQLRDNNDYLVKEAVFAPMERANTIIAVRQEVAREIFAEIDRAVVEAELEWGSIFGVKWCIAELKKKYTEGASE